MRPWWSVASWAVWRASTGLICWICLLDLFFCNRSDSTRGKPLRLRGKPLLNHTSSTEARHGRAPKVGRRALGVSLR
jgi:hypothetical protein